MNVLVLGGNSARHFEWVRAVADTLRPVADEVRLHDYKHWRTGEPDADIEYELHAVAELAERLDDYILVAKSIGTVISALGNARGTLAPKGCLLLGFPLSVVQTTLPAFGPELTRLPRTVFLQNSTDPLGSAADVTAFMQQHTPKQWRLQSVPGSTHDYLDMQLIQQLCQELMTEHLA